MAKPKRIKTVEKLNLSEHTLDINVRKCSFDKFRFSNIEDYVRAVTGGREYQYRRRRTGSITINVQVLIQQPDFQIARNYWKVLKNRLHKEGSESVTNCHRLKLEAAGGKKYLTDVADPETLLCLM